MRKILIAITALLLITYAGFSEEGSLADFSFRDDIYFGYTYEEVKAAETLDFIHTTKSVDDESGFMRTYATTFWGVVNSDIKYDFDKSGKLCGATISDGSYLEKDIFLNRRENYAKWESELTKIYGDQLGGSFHSPTAIIGEAFQNFVIYDSRPDLKGTVVNCSERVVMLENYNVKIEHVLIESAILGSSHYISYDKFTDEDAPEWAENKTGIPYGQEISENKPEISEIPFDFKKLHWGASEADIREIEGVPLQVVDMPESNSKCLIYQTTAVGLDVGLGYILGDNGLYSVRYTLIEEHSSALGYMNDFKKFKDALVEKYGNPVLDWEEWDSEISEEIYSNAKTLALEMGYLKYHVGFDTDRTEILMLMGADNNEIDTVIVYTSKITANPKPDYSDEI